MLNMLKKHAMTQPDQIALVHEGFEVTYAELYNKSVRLAGWFRQQGVEPKDRIVVAASRSVDTAIALYAVLLCGATYVPLEHTYPTERITSLIQEIAPKVVIVSAAYQQMGLLQCQVLCTGSAPKSALSISMAVAKAERNGWSVEDMPKFSDRLLAYIMFTSGSTGHPKGVCIERGSIFRFVEKYCRAMSYEHDIRMLGITSLSGDGSMIQHLCVHNMGGTLFVYDYKFPNDLIHSVAKWKITDIDCSATLVKIMTSPISGLSKTALPCLKRISYGGDSLPLQYIKEVKRLITQVNVFNGYGPTECTVLSSLYQVGEEILTQNDETPVPIGRPFEGVQFLLVDDQNQPVPLGKEGELLIGGEQVMRGYFEDPLLTKAVFTNVGGSTYYRTGDIVVQGADENYIFKRRKNDMLKVRGYRIYPGEIEKEVRAFPGVKDCFVVKHVRGLQESLRAYLIPEQGAVINLDTFRRFLSQKLPQYMLPSSIKFMDAIPVCPNGKVDRKEISEWE